eukprot:4642855-Ditylum_brightwellii.AAC.1
MDRTTRSIAKTSMTETKANALLNLGCRLDEEEEEVKDTTDHKEEEYEEEESDDGVECNRQRFNWEE